MRIRNSSVVKKGSFKMAHFFSKYTFDTFLYVVKGNHSYPHLTIPRLENTNHELNLQVINSPRWDSIKSKVITTQGKSRPLFINKISLGK